MCRKGFAHHHVGRCLSQETPTKRGVYESPMAGISLMCSSCLSLMPCDVNERRKLCRKLCSSYPCRNRGMEGER